MTITLTSAVLIAGAVEAADTTHTLDAAVEADLVRRGLAAYVAAPVRGGLDGLQVREVAAADLAAYAGRFGEVIEVHDAAGRPQFRFDGSGLALVSAGHGRTITAAADATLTDAGALVTYDAATPGALTIPSDATAGWSGAVVLSLCQAGAGAPSFAAGAGVTLRAPLGAASAEQYGVISARRIGADEWTLL